MFSARCTLHVADEIVKILVAHNVSCRHRGGMARIMEYLHVPLRDDGHRVDFLCAEDAPPVLRGRAGRFGFPLLVWRRARDAARRGEPYDVVNVHEPSAAAIAIFKRAAGARTVVVTTHGVEQRAFELAREEARLGRSPLPLRTRIGYPLTSLWQCRIGLTRADHVFCLNTQDRDYLERRLGVRPDRVTRIFPGADAVYADVAGPRDYARADRILFAGTWRTNKGIADLVPSFSELAGRHPAVTLRVLGAGVPQQAVRAAFPAPIRQRIHLVTSQTEEESAAVFAGADAFVLPSVFEGTPLTLIEAMMSGLPIVTTDTCGMRDVIAHEETGLLVPPRSPGAIRDALERLLADRTLRARLGQAAREEARARYTWPAAARVVRRAYEALVSPP